MKAEFYRDAVLARLGKKVVEKKTIAQPGFGSPIGGSMTKLALDYLCANPPK